jgi:heme/copper-type cytochrome/quinol oxidase subunit 3
MEPVPPAEVAEVRGFGTAGAGKIGMWVFLATDVMAFGALLLAYAALRVQTAGWPDPAARLDRTQAAALTFVLLGSGATMAAVPVLLRAGRRRAARWLAVITAIAGLVFIGGQALEFLTLATVRGVGLSADHAAALFYVITGFHGLHVLVGVVALAAIAAVALRRGRPGAERATEVVALYWQFVDVVWIVLYSIFYLVPSVSG